MDEGYYRCVPSPNWGVPARYTPFGSESATGQPKRLAVSKCFPVCPRKQNSDRRVKLSPKGGPPMMRGEQHETHDRCSDSPDDVSSRSNSGASTNRSRRAIERTGGDRTDQH